MQNKTEDFAMIHTVQISHPITGGTYCLTDRDGKLWLENHGDEGMHITEIQLFEMIDKYFIAHFDAP